LRFVLLEHLDSVSGLEIAQYSIFRAGPAPQLDLRAVRHIASLRLGLRRYPNREKHEA